MRERRRLALSVGLVAGALVALASVVAPPAPLVDHVEIVGETALVYPTVLGRVWPDITGEEAWREVQTRVPDAFHTSTVRDQLICHWHFARLIPMQRTWGLDRDRPDVGYARATAAGCNP